MQAYDVFMLTVVVAAAVWGAWKGLAWQIASFASIGLSYFVSVNFRGQVAKYFHYQPPEFNSMLAMLVLYVGTTFIVWVAFNMLRDFLEKVQLREFDRQIGGLLGLVKGVLVATVITLFTVGLGTETQRQAVMHSKSGYVISQLLKKVEPLVPQEYRHMVDDAIARLEDRYGMPRGSYEQGQSLPSGGWGVYPQANNTWGTNSNSWSNTSPIGTLNNTNPSGELFTQNDVQRIQSEILTRLQQNGYLPNANQINPNDYQRIQNEIVARLQQGNAPQQNGQIQWQQTATEILGRLLQPQPQNPPPTQPGYAS